MSQAVRFEEESDLRLVAEYFSSQALSVERFSQAETQTGKTPDFRVKYNGEVVAYCEVKSPNDPWLDEMLEKGPASTVIGGPRNDPVFNRLRRSLIKAKEQLAAVNADTVELNIVAYVNHDAASHPGDLIELLTGYLYLDDGTKEATMSPEFRASPRVIQQGLDLFLWFDGGSGRLQQTLFSQTRADRIQKIMALLKVDTAAVGQL